MPSRPVSHAVRQPILTYLHGPRPSIDYSVVGAPSCMHVMRPPGEDIRLEESPDMGLGDEDNPGMGLEALDTRG